MFKIFDKIIAEWQIASNYYQNMIVKENGIAETINSTDIDTRCTSKIKAIVSDVLFQQTFSNCQIELKQVEIEKLVAPQRLVNLDYVEKLIEKLPETPKSEDLIDFCLNPQQMPPAPKIQQVAQNMVSCSSISPQFRFLGGFPKQLIKEDILASHAGGLPVAAFILLIGYGSPVCNVLSVNDRMILNNGFHRMYALGKIGIKHAPVVIQKITAPDLEFPPNVAGLPKEYLLNHKRPVIMRDFFDSKLVKIIHKKPTITGLQLSWNFNQAPVPI